MFCTVCLFEVCCAMVQRDSSIQINFWLHVNKWTAVGQTEPQRRIVGTVVSRAAVCDTVLNSTGLNQTFIKFSSRENLCQTVFPCFGLQCFSCAALGSAAGL